MCFCGFRTFFEASTAHFDRFSATWHFSVPFPQPARYCSHFSRPTLHIGTLALQSHSDLPPSPTSPVPAPHLFPGHYPTDHPRRPAAATLPPSHRQTHGVGRWKVYPPSPPEGVARAGIAKKWPASKKKFSGFHFPPQFPHVLDTFIDFFSNFFRFLNFISWHVFSLSGMCFKGWLL